MKENEKMKKKYTIKAKHIYLNARSPLSSLPHKFVLLEIFVYFRILTFAFQGVLCRNPTKKVNKVRMIFIDARAASSKIVYDLSVKYAPCSD